MRRPSFDGGLDVASRHAFCTHTDADIDALDRGVHDLAELVGVVSVVDEGDPDDADERDRLDDDHDRGLHRHLHVAEGAFGQRDHARAVSPEERDVLEVDLAVVRVVDADDRERGVGVAAELGVERDGESDVVDPVAPRHACDGGAALGLLGVEPDEVDPGGGARRIRLAHDPHVSGDSDPALKLVVTSYDDSRPFAVRGLECREEALRGAVDDLDRRPLTEPGRVGRCRRRVAREKKQQERG